MDGTTKFTKLTVKYESYGSKCRTLKELNNTSKKSDRFDTIQKANIGAYSMWEKHIY